MLCRKAHILELTELLYPKAWQLWLQTGWNGSYRIGYDDFVKSWNGSLIKKCILNEGTLVAIGRANTDGVLYAMIHDVVVHNDFRGKGFGRMIMSELLFELESIGIRVIQLMAAKNQAGFYEKFGFCPRLPDRPGMQYLTIYAQQSNTPDTHERALDS